MTVKQSSMLRKLSNQRSSLAEGPCWSTRSNGLYWVDIPGKKLYFCRKDGPVSSWSFEQKISAVVEAKNGGLILMLAKNIIHFDVITGSMSTLFDIDLDIPSNRSNDAKCDPWGNLWVGTMDDQENKKLGRLHVFSVSGKHVVLLDNIGVSNTLAWNERRSIVYFADSMAGEIYQFSMKISKDLPVLSKKELFFNEPADSHQSPDGSAIDSEGFLWNAKWGGNKVVRYSPDGEVDFILDIPAINITSCCFGGPENKTLFITTALDNPSRGINNATKDGGDGYVYCIDLSVGGAKTCQFG